jgi:hypothetical protein
VHDLATAALTLVDFQRQREVSRAEEANFSILD